VRYKSLFMGLVMRYMGKWERWERKIKNENQD
jgi:hypothetical protein